MALKYFPVFIFLFFLAESVFSNPDTKISQSLTPTWTHSPTKTPIVPDLDDVSDGYYFESIEYQVNVEKGSTYYKSTKVLFDGSGAENAGQINISFNPTYQSLVIHELKIIRGGQEINKLDLKKFKLLASETELSRFIYNGTFSAYCIIDDLRKDDKLIVAYSITGLNPVFENIFFDSYYLQNYEPIGLIYVNYLVPAERNIKFKSHSNAPQPQQSLRNNIVQYQWEIAGVQKAEYIDYQPSWATSLQWIEFSEFSSWSEVSKWAKRINPISKIATNSPLFKFTEEIWQKAKGNKYKFLQYAVDFVQNEVRYMGVESGEYSHRANTPEKVFQQRYGDCKDKSVLLTTILNAKGIEASLVLANTFKDYGLDKELPSPVSFNHMVVRVEIDKRLQFIDPTMTNQGGDIKNRYFPYYGEVLDLHPSRADMLTQVDKNEHSKIALVETYKLLGQGKATLSVETKYYQGEADNIRQYFKNTAKNSIQKSYLDYYVRIHSKLTKKDNLRFTDDPVNNIFTVYESYQIEDIAVLDEGTKRNHIPIFANHISDKIPTSTETREQPMALSFPVNLEYDLNIVSSNAREINMDPENIFYDRSAYLFSKNVKTEGDTLQVRYRLIFHDTFIGAKDIPKFIEDFRQRDAIFNCGYFLDDDGYLNASLYNNGSVNWVMLLFLFFTVALSILTLRKYNKSTATNFIEVYDFPRYESLGGWLILLLISLIMSVIKIASQHFSTDYYFGYAVWNSTDLISGVSPFWYKALLVFEFIGNTACMVGFIYAVSLMLKKRDIFPQTLFFLLFGMILFYVADWILGIVILHENYDELEGLKTILQSFVYVAIWCTYLKKSERVKGTFTVRFDGYTHPTGLSTEEVFKNEE